jgi:hypothetical protein
MQNGYTCIRTLTNTSLFHVNICIHANGIAAPVAKTKAPTLPRKSLRAYTTIQTATY